MDSVLSLTIKQHQAAILTSSYSCTALGSCILAMHVQPTNNFVNCVLTDEWLHWPPCRGCPVHKFLHGQGTLITMHFRPVKLSDKLLSATQLECETGCDGKGSRVVGYACIFHKWFPGLKAAGSMSKLVCQCNHG